MIFKHTGLTVSVVTQQRWLQELQETVTEQQDIITRLNSQVQQHAQETKHCNVEVTKLKDIITLQDQRISKLKKYSRYGVENGPDAGKWTEKNASRHGQLSLRNLRMFYFANCFVFFTILHIKSFYFN